LLVWDIERAPKVTRYADRVLNPLVGKSLVVYLMKPAVTGPEVTKPATSGAATTGATGANRLADGSSGQRAEPSLAGAGVPS
jgi:hypothetical protein